MLIIQLITEWENHLQRYIISFLFGCATKLFNGLYLMNLHTYFQKWSFQCTPPPLSLSLYFSPILDSPGECQYLWNSNLITKKQISFALVWHKYLQNSSIYLFKWKVSFIFWFISLFIFMTFSWRKKEKKNIEIKCCKLKPDILSMFWLISCQEAWWSAHAYSIRQ